MNTVKLTVTIPRDEFRMIEQEKKHQGLSRSALIQKMIESFFERKIEERKISSYINGYRKKPEVMSEGSPRTSAQMDVLGEF